MLASRAGRCLVALLVVTVAPLSSFHATASSQAGAAGEATKPSTDSLLQLAEEDSLLLARSLVVERKLGPAEALLRRILPRREARFGSTSVEVMRVLDLLVQCLWQGGKSQTEETARLADRAVAIKEEIFGPDHPEVARSLFSLGVIRAMGGDYAGAEPIFARVLAIREAHLPPEHEDMASSINALANIRYLLSDFAGALPLYRRSLAIAESVGGPLDAQAISIRGNVANTLIKLAAYRQARAVLDRQIDLLESEGLEIEDLGYAYSLLGAVFTALEDHQEALRVRRRSLEIREVFHPENHPRIAESLLNMGNTLCKLGRLEEGVPLIERAREIWKTQYGPEHPYISSFDATLAQIALEQGRLGEARQLGERALAICEQSIGPETPRAAEILRSLGCVALEEGRYEESREKLETAVRIVAQQIGAHHPLVAEYGCDLARLALCTGEPRTAMEQALSAAEIQVENLRLTLRALPERQALHYARRARLPLDLALSAIHDVDDPELTARVWDVLIRSRALVFDAMAARTRRTVLAIDSTAAERLETFQRGSTRLANLIVRGPEDADPIVYRQMIEDARIEMENAERSLTREGASPGRAEAQIGRAEVFDALPDGSGLVSYVRYQRHQAGPSNAFEARPWYRVFVLPGSGSAPVTLDIGDAGGFDALIADWRREAGRPPAPDDDRTARIRAYRDVGNVLRELIWDPIAARLDDPRRVFVVPDGQFYLLNLAALPAPGGGYLLESSLRFHHLSAEREIAASQAAMPRDGGPARATESGADRDGALVVGAPDFDRSPTASATSVRAPGREPAASFAARRLFRGRRPDCADLRSRRFEPLPDSRREAQEIAALWSNRSANRARGPATSGSQDTGVLLLTGSGASETAFKEAAPGKRILHLATHAYFLDPQCLAESEGVGIYNPLLLSGLALAGANHRQESASDSDDGILTAQEIAALDLSATRWAVLSACETGIGEIQSGEGVLGLQRAFRMAGARSLITSLWSVEDEAARHWMGAFYRAAAEEGSDTAESVRTASLAVLRERAGEGPDAHPFFWAAFVASGDWR